MTLVRIVRADPWTGRVPDGSAVNGQQLIVLAGTVPTEDGGHRAVPLWLPVIGAKLLLALLDRPAGDAVMAGVLEETAPPLPHAAGVAVTAMDIDPAGEDVPELRSDTAAARVGLATAAGTRHVLVSAGYGLALAVVAGAPVRVADEVMDRLAVPVQGEDVLAPFLLPAPGWPPEGPGQARRFEPRNMAFTDGLEEPPSGEVLAGGQSLSHMSRNARMCRRSGPALSPRQPRMAVARTLAAAAAAIVLLAACGPSGGEAKAAAAKAGSTGDCASLTTCYAPNQFRVAYGIEPLLKRGIDGRGETVVLPELAATGIPSSQLTDIRQDMGRFDSLFHLPAARLEVSTHFGGSSSPWLANDEEVLDAEMVHVVAPGAAIAVDLVDGSGLTSSEGTTGALAGVTRLATSQGSILSISAAWGEHCFTRAEVATARAALRYGHDHHMTVIAGSGDTGPISHSGNGSLQDCQASGPEFTPVREVSLPASDPLVLSAGGTSLTASHATGAYVSESAWGLPDGTPGTGFQASGGGFSHLFARPSYQDGVPGTGATRSVPDVAADASGHAGLALVLSAGQSHYTIRNGGGTSAAGPFWAGVIALADQSAGRPLGFVNAAIYRIARSPRYHDAFHDITAGDNSVVFNGRTIRGYMTSRGWDPVTGWGSPDVQVLVPLLPHQVHPGDGEGL